MSETSDKPKDYSGVAFCKHCGYSLIGLPEPRCPECGKSFDPCDPRTMRVPGWKDPRRKPFIEPVPFGEQILKLGGLGCFVLLCEVADEWNFPLLTFFAALVWGCFFVTILNRFVFDRQNPNRLWDGPPWKLRLTVMLTITFLLTLLVDRCDHGLHVEVFGFDCSRLMGTNCNNGRCWKSIFQLTYRRLEDRP